MSASGSPPPTFASLSIHKSDCIRFLQFPEDIHTDAQPVILAVWPPGIQTSGLYGDAYQCKLKGRPFGRLFGPEVVGGIRVVRDLIIFLGGRSWELVTPLLCSGHPGAKDTLIFRRRGVDLPAPAPMEWLVLGLLRSDRLRVVYDAEDCGKLLGGGVDGAGRDHHLGGLIAGLKKMLEGLDGFQRGEWSYDSFEFKLKGMPWHAHGVKTVRVRLLMLKVFEVLDSFGWQARVAVGQRSGGDDHRMPDTLYFARARGE